MAAQSDRPVAGRHGRALLHHRRPAEGYEENHIWEYDKEFRYLRTHVLESGYANPGIQTARFHDGYWWFGCHMVEKKKGLLKADADLNLVGIYDVSPSIGLVGRGAGRFRADRHFGEKWHARVVPMQPDSLKGPAAAR